jgi:ubiquinone/menaquinone biosynthesis C-methylase UbiE
MECSIPPAGSLFPSIAVYRKAPTTADTQYPNFKMNSGHHEETRIEEWKRFWEETAEKATSNFEYDHGHCPREKDIETLSTKELLHFIAPQSSDTIFDAGCGTGGNILLLHSKVKRIIGMDYAAGAIMRCRERICSAGIDNVDLMQGIITNPSLSDSSVDKVLCTSVLQYLDDGQVRAAFAQFNRVLKDGGTLILHVKNSSSLYLSTLWAAKKLKAVLGKRVRIEYYRPFRWYTKELQSAGFEVVDYNSFNLLMLELMPKSVLLRLQRIELQHYDKSFFRAEFVRRHGSDLKIKARIKRAV